MNKAALSPQALERVIALLAAVACLAISAVVWRNVSAFQGMWPLPAAYLIELPALSILAAVILARAPAAPAAYVVWAVAGLCLAFCFLGAFSVGSLYLPVTVLWAVSAVIHDIRCRGSLARHLLTFFVAGLAQGGLMLTVIRLLG